jgi:hypothetical protein
LGVGGSREQQQARNRKREKTSQHVHPQLLIAETVARFFRAEVVAFP